MVTSYTSVSPELKRESVQLLRDYEQTRSAAIRNQLVTLNMGLVRKEAHFWSNQCTESYDDLLQVGCMGLIRAIERFELSKGNAFSPDAGLLYSNKQWDLRKSGGQNIIVNLQMLK